MGKKYCAGSRGSFTVEAAIIFAVIFSTFLVSLWFVLIMYQNLHMTIVAQDASIVLGKSWAGLSSSDLKTGDFKNGQFTRVRLRSLYRRSFGFTASDRTLVHNHILESSDRMRILEGYEAVHVPVVKPGFPMKKVQVSVKELYPWPVGGFGRGYNQDLVITTRLNDPAELIRNIDFIFDIGKSIVNRGD